MDGPLPKLYPAVALSRQDGRHSAVALLLKAALIQVSDYRLLGASGLIDCSLYDNGRRSFFEEINRLNVNFCNLDVKGKLLWLMTNEDHLILYKLGEYLLKNFNKRTKELTSVNTKTKQTKK